MSTDSSPALLCSALHKSYGPTVALAGFDLRVHPGELLVLFGPSGCGKTTALRLIAGIDEPDSGEIWIGGRKVTGDSWVPPEDRHIGMVFQDWALFPHLDVEKNVAFGVRGSREYKRKRVAEVLELVRLPGYGHRMPHELSGGQQQRVALARALASDPQVVLMDEPFSNLDASLRADLRAEVREVLYDAGTTAVFVTHDREEALSLADRVAVMVNGRVLEVGTPQQLYAQPSSALIASMLGEANVYVVPVEGGVARTPFGEIPANGFEGPVTMLVRPEAVSVETCPGGEARVLDIQYYGHDQLVHLELADGSRLEARTFRGEPVLQQGQRVKVRLLDKPWFFE